MFMIAKIQKLSIAGIIVLFSACQQGQETTTANSTESAFHKVVVEEVLQASEYTYLHAKEKSNEVWLAVPAMQAKAGDTYYYENGIEMKQFESKELNKVFPSILLLEKLNTEPNSSAVVATNTANTKDASATTPDAGATSTGSYQRKSTPPEKKEVKVGAAKGGTTIAKLYAAKDDMAGKIVKIKGQVTKYTPAVMNKNWIHIQDGTDANGKFDLTVTSSSEVKVGDVVTLEGRIALNKDLGYGYFFDVIMEDAVLK
jgi:hypothetical protein